MLRLTYDAVERERAVSDTAKVKDRYAIIDEVQDTSVLQWEIFRRLFVDESRDGFSAADIHSG
jgi:ATP-dependent exoDNAse (exonuclease V) beta subunit